MIFWTFFTRINFQYFRKKYLKLNKLKLKCLVIKPYFYLDLYTNTFLNKKKIINSSYYRLGPVGLFLDLKSDFLISNPLLTQDLKYQIKNRIKNIDNKKLMLLQKKNSIKEKKINFTKYDLIFMYKDAVSNKLVKKHSNKKWAIILEDHSDKNYKKYLIKKPYNFDFFLNHTQGYTPYSFMKKKHVIDFSYTFSSKDFLKNMNLKKTNKIDILIEIQQPDYVKDRISSPHLSIEKLEGNLNNEQYLKKLSSSKIFFCPIFTTPRWGNSIIEAAICKNLIIGNAYNYWNSLLIHKDLHCTSINEGKKIYTKILSDKKLFYYYLNEQNKVLQEINYNNPITQILNLL